MPETTTLANKRVFIFAADFETLVPGSKTFEERKERGETALSSVVLWTIKPVFNYEQIDNSIKVGYTIQDFWKQVKEYGKELGYKLIIYFHNGAKFDFSFISQELFRMEGIKKLSERKDKNSFLEIPQWVGNKKDKIFKNFCKEKSGKIKKDTKVRHYKIHYGQGKIEWITGTEIYYKPGKKSPSSFSFEFRDSVKLLQASIEGMGKVLGYVKMEAYEELKEKGLCKDKEEFYQLVDFNLRNPENKEIEFIKNKIEQYAKQDCEILAEHIRNYQKILIDNNPFNCFLQQGIYLKGKNETKQIPNINCLNCSEDHRINLCIECKNFHPLCKCENNCKIHLINDKTKGGCFTYGKTLDSVKNVLSTPSLMFQLFKGYIPKEELYCKDLDTYQRGLLGYYGGITQKNKQIKYFSLKGITGRYCDINSCYGCVMSDFLIPYGELICDNVFLKMNQSKICKDLECIISPIKRCQKEHWVSYYELTGEVKIKDKWKNFPLWPKQKDSIKFFNLGKGNLSGKKEIDSNFKVLEMFKTQKEILEKEYWEEKFQEHQEKIKNLSRSEKRKLGKFKLDNEEFITNAKGMWWMWEIEFLQYQEMYEFNGEIKKFWAKTTDSFSAQTRYMYQQRLIAKKEKNEIINFLNKLCINASYGKFGEQIQYESVYEEPIKIDNEGNEIKRNIGDSIILHTSTFFPNSPEGQEKKEEWDRENNYNKEFIISVVQNEKGIKSINGKRIETRLYKIIAKEDIQDLLEKDRVRNILAAGFITAGARYLLKEGMKVIGPDNIIYCDTDSIIFKTDNEIKEGETVEELYQRYPLNYDNNKLGAFKIEDFTYVNSLGKKKTSYTFNGFKGVARKTYYGFVFDKETNKYYEGKKATSGISKDKASLTFEEIEKIEKELLEDNKISTELWNKLDSYSLESLINSEETRVKFKTYQQGRFKMDKCDNGKYPVKQDITKYYK